MPRPPTTKLSSTLLKKLIYNWNFCRHLQMCYKKTFWIKKTTHNGKKDLQMRYMVILIIANATLGLSVKYDHWPITRAPLLIIIDWLSISRISFTIQIILLTYKAGLAPCIPAKSSTSLDSSIKRHLHSSIALLSTVAGQNVLGRPDLTERNLGGSEGKKPWKFLKFSFLKLLQMHPILNTSSYIWGSHLLLPFSLHLSKIIGGSPPPSPSPGYGTASTKSKQIQSTRFNL